jgi:atlastin
MKVLNDPNFRGQLKDIDEDFKKHLNEFIPYILSPSNILVKKISGNEVKCGDLYGYFKEYVKIFQVKSRRGERETERQRDRETERQRDRE